MKIHVFCVGGTIDKIYFDAKSEYEVGAPAIRKMLLQIAVNLDIEVTSLMAKDSLEMTDEDREIIAQAVKSCEADKIIITHGTDTMPDTARSLGELSNKVVVLTGALAPAIFKDSDAMFNVGGALAAVQALDKGVYIVMNGELFDATNVRKDVENNCFRRLS
ncbi:MAG: asparaginase [Arenicella sp.]|nr:asparaginase [Arenicella sp.]